MPVVFTNSADMKPKHKTDFYPTSQGVLKVGVVLGTTKPPKNLLDMGRGTGSLGASVKSILPEAHIVGYEIDPDLPKQDTVIDTVYVADFLYSVVKPDYDLVTGNPPFRHAFEFVKMDCKFIKPQIDSRNELNFFRGGV